MSESIDGRSALFLPCSSSTPAQVDTLRFRGTVSPGGRRGLLDGVNRLAGFIPSCGGRGGDRPTQRPRHGLNCRDSSELILLTPRFGSRTPRLRRRGAEAVVRDGAVVATRRGGRTAIPRDGYMLAATGRMRAFLAAGAKPGASAAIQTSLVRGRGAVSLSAWDSIVGVGPRLVRGAASPSRAGGRGSAATPASAAGSSPAATPGPGRPGLGWRVFLVTVDGRQRRSVGASLGESPRIMRSLGASDAVNLDGGGSTAMTVRGRLVNRPSDPGGERRVGDGIFVLPGSSE